MSESGERLMPAVAFVMIHAASIDWAAGTGFSSRYLVPVLPVLAVAVSQFEFRTRWVQAALFYSTSWGILAGFFPALVYDRSPWGVISYIATYLTR